MQEIDKAEIASSMMRVSVSAPPPADSLLPFETDGAFQRATPFRGLLVNQLLTSLPGPDFARLLPFITSVSLIAGQDIFKCGELASHVYFPETAVVSHLHLLEDGSTSAATVVGKEGLIGLSAILDSRPAPYWSHVTIGGTAWSVAADVLRSEFTRGTALQKSLLSYAHLRMTALSQQAVCNSRHLMFERLCAWLLMVSDRAGDSKLPLTHERIAQHLGARRAGITSGCNVLRDQGAIRYQRGLIHIVDRNKLEALACECYGVLKQLWE